MTRSSFTGFVAPDSTPARGEADSPTGATDSEVVAAVQGGDPAAFEALFSRYYRRLVTFVEGYVRSTEVAEDLTVDLFVRLWERRAEWALHGSLRSYLYSAARNEALAYLRRQRMAERVHAGLLQDDDVPGMGRPPAAADAQAQASELAEALDRAIAELPERGREALVLHRKHGLSYAEVAETMGISPRTVEVHIRRAFQALRVSLSRFLPVFLVVLL